MKVIYAGLNTKKRKALTENEDDVIILLYDKWDDYNYKTTFPTDCRMNGQEVEIGSLRILIEDEKTSFSYLDKLVAEGWDGVFPIPNTVYISTPATLSFYEQIEGHIYIETAIDVAQILRDASYLTKIKDNEDALRLLTTEGFRLSLQRERGAIKAFLDGWKLFGKKNISIGNQTFKFKSTKGDVLPLELRFASGSPLPHDINVLIGPNGVGKSQLLHQLVKSWLQLDPNSADEIGFTERPNLNQVVVISYSPFELFPVDTSEDKERRDHDVYKYFGLRGRKKSLTDSKRGSDKVTLSREFPKANAARSLLNCLSDDQRYGAIKEWSNKVQAMERVLGRAIDFDRAAVVVNAETDFDEFFTTKAWLDEPYLVGELADEDGEPAVDGYVPIASDRIDNLKVAALRKHVHDRSGVVFLKGGKPVHLSSGQRLFSYTVINILGAIQRNSLILVDEPELFLHPSLEIAFVRMLKSILASYGSKALVATHSLVTVREIPRDCVHVFEDTTEGIVIKTPPFETFGGDVQRISSYVFGDKSLSKPYEEWVTEQLNEFGSAEQLIAALGDDTNEELLIQINAMGDGLW
jgi:ABC-type Mn2+/Zn2+ transport system ATPase subunit